MEGVTVSDDAKTRTATATSTSVLAATTKSGSPTTTPKKVEGGLFVGIEDAARASRQRELRTIRCSGEIGVDSCVPMEGVPNVNTAKNADGAAI